ncbi:S24 family peptidase [Methylobrevis pamukkalensis]|uniref:HTH cro/C1-type domain-containing protein n=1 Tax=Methylobrevis pamukkalensis TaxID=1439726 RepID=A0A1E3GYT4_9HYPH|nr:S24 family peptidase [Methylobrevis pamukkalensis]ODN69213.1 hypothetical protein A6302_03475 [Methylobrevis pamukkalensis]
MELHSVDDMRSNYVSQFDASSGKTTKCSDGQTTFRRMTTSRWATHHDRLRWARERRFDQIKLAAEALGVNEKTLQAHETGTRGTRGFPQALAEKYARGLGVSASWLMSGKGEPTSRTPETMRRVSVSGYLQAGVWSENHVLAPDEEFDVFIPDRPEFQGWPLYGAIVRGESMNQVYPAGTIVVLMRKHDGARDLVPGKRYHIDRAKPDGTRESTIKTVKIRREGEVWLVPESDDPAFQAAIPLNGGETGIEINFVAAWWRP